MIDLFSHLRGYNVLPPKTAWFCFVFFLFLGSEGKATAHWPSPLGTLVSAPVIMLYAI